MLGFCDDRQVHTFHFALSAMIDTAQSIAVCNPAPVLAETEKQFVLRSLISGSFIAAEICKPNGQYCLSRIYTTDVMASTAGDDKQVEKQTT